MYFFSSKEEKSHLGGQCVCLIYSGEREDVVACEFKRYLH